jgi:hypothetical protein
MGNALEVDRLLTSMLGAASKEAGAQWKDIRAIATIEFKTYAQRVREVVETYLGKKLKKETALMLMAMARNHLIATIAMLTVKTYAALQKIIDAATKAISQAVNARIGFGLI